MAKQLNKSVSGGSKINFSIGFNTDKTTLNEIKTSLNEIQKMTSSDLMSLNKGMDLATANTQLKEIRQTASTVQQALSNSFNKDLGTTNITKFNNELAKSGLSLTQIASTFNAAGAKGQAAFRNITTELLTTEVQLKKTHNLIQDMANTMANTVKWGIASSVMNSFSGSVQKAYGYVKELDTSLNNIRIVTGKSARDMESFSKKANDAAKALGAQTTTYTDAALIYYQQGLGDEESQARAETTVKAANVTGMSGSDTSEALTAVWNGYKVQADETELYVDKLAKVAAGTAADLEELSTGMSKVASAANTAGVDIDQLNATLATVISVTREAPETIGSAFKTIYARMGDLKLDGEDEYGVKLGAVSGQLHELGIELLDSQGNMRDMGTVIEETAAKWNTWTQAQKQAAAVAMAGKMQYSRLMSLFENWDMYNDAIDMSRNSMGELQKQQSIYLQSTEAHLKTAKASWEGVYAALMKPEDVNAGLDAVSTLAERLEGVINVLGNGKGVLLALGSTALSVFKDQIGTGLATTLMNLKAVNSNAEQMAAQFQLLQQIKSIGIDDKATQDIIKMKEELLEYSHLLTEDQQNQALAFINARNEIEKEKDAILDAQQAASEFFSQRTNMQTGDTNTFTRNAETGEGKIDFLNNTGGLGESGDSATYEEQIKVIDEALKGYENTLKELTDTYQQYREVQAAEDSGNASAEQVADAYNRYKEAVQETREQMAHLADSTIATEKETEDLVECYKQFDKAYKTVENMEDAYDELGDEIKDMRKVFSSTIKDIQKASAKTKDTIKKNMEDPFAKVEKKVTDFKKKYADFKKELSLADKISSVTGMISAFGQFASVIGSVQNLWSGLKDGSLELTDVFTTLPILIGQTASGFNSLNSVFKTLSGGTSILQAIKGNLLQINLARQSGFSIFEAGAIKEKALYDAEAAAEEAKKLRTNANLALKDVEITKTETAAAVKAGEITADEAATLVKGKEAAASTADAIAKEAETKATEAATVAQWAQNAALYANPIVLIVAAIIAAVAALALLTAALISNAREQQKANDLEKAKQDLAEKSKVADKAREESEAIRTLADGYRDLYKEYDAGRLKLDEMSSKTYDLVKAYGDEELKVLALTGQYKELAKAIDEAQKKQNEETIEASKDEQKSIQNAIRADIRKNRKESEIDKNAGGVSGWSIDLKGTNGINSKAENDLINKLSDLGIDTGNGSGHISLEDFTKVATENQEELREILNNSETKAAGQLLDILEDEKDYLEQFDNSLTEMQKAQKENLGIKYTKDELKDVEDYEKRVQDMANEAVKKGLFKDDKSGREAAKKWAESFLSAASDEFKDASDRSALSNTIADSLKEQYIKGAEVEPGQLFDNKGFQELKNSDMFSVMPDQTEQLTSALKDLNAEQLTAIASTKNYSDQLLLLWKSTGSAENAVKAMAAATSGSANASHELSDSAKKSAEALERNEEGLKGYIKYIQKSNKALEDDYELAEAVAVRQMKLADALSKCVDSWEEWMDNLEEVDKGTIDYYDTLGEMADAFSDVFGTDLSTQFIEDNLTDLKALINGDVDAFNRLQEAAAKDYVANMVIYSNDKEEIERIKNELNQFIQDYGNTDLKTTLTADDTNLINTLNNALKEGKMTEDQMNKYLAGIGYKGKVTYVDAPGPTTESTISANILGKDIKLGKIKTTSKVKVPQIESVTKTTDKVATANSFTGNTIKSATQGSNAVGGGKSGGGSDKDPDKKDLNEDELDRYEKVNVQLDLISATLDKLQSQEDKLFGSKLIDNLNKQLQTLNKQIDKTNEKLKIARGEQSELQAKLRSYGVQFDAEGVMTNYAQVFQAQQQALNNIYNHYNNLSAASQEGYEATVENAEKNWEKFKDAVDAYDSLVGSTIPGLEQDIQDAVDEQIEIKIKEFDMEIELALDIKDAQDKWNEFRRNIIKGLKDEDILGNALESLERFADYYNEAGIGVLQEENKYLKDLMAQIDQYNASGWSDWYGDNETAMMEDLKQYYEQAFDDLQNVKDLVDEIHEALNETLEDVADRMEEQMDYYEAISDTLEHDMKMVELVYGDEAFGRLELYYEEQEKNYNNQLEFQRAQVDFWKQQMDALDKGSEEWETARDNWLNAVGEWQSMVESAIENLTDKYLNTINKIFQELNNQVTKGAGMDFINTEWELIQKHADEYLDTINSTYGIQQLQNKYLDAMNNTDNLAYQRKLNELMKAEVADLKARDRLTQYDLDRAELKYQIALKQIALQEAQQNKSTMRLKRDTQGNYTYQYVSDDDEVKKVQEEISDLYNQLYNLDVDRYTGNLDQLYEIWMEYQEKMAEAAAINDPEARLQKEQLLTQQYGDLIDGIVDQNEQIKRNLYESTFLELEDLYGKQAEIVQDFLDNQDDAMSLLVNGWASGLQEMADQIYAEGGFEPTYEQALADITEATADYEESLKQLQDSAKVTFETLGEDVDEVETEVQQLINKTDELIGTFTNEVEQIKDVIGQIDELNNHYQEQTKVINTAIDAYNKYIQKMREAEQAANKNTSSNGGSGQPTGGASGNGSSGGGGGAGNANRMPSVGQWVTYNGGYYYADSYGNGGRGSRGPGKRVKVTIVKNDGRPYPIHVESSDSAYGWLRKDQLSGYDTGGYTGSWGSTEGRVALLHEKELVLNKEDTKNLLDTVEVMRNLTNSLGSSILKQMASMSRTGINGMVGGDVVEQDVHIDAQFPNVRDSREIEDALNNLVNAAAQRANKR